MPTREQVFSALAALLSDVPGINSVSRRMSMPADFDGSNLLPRLMIWEQNETTIHTGSNQGLGIPPKRTWDAWLVIYFTNPSVMSPGTNPDSLVPGATIINPILDAIEAALAPNVVTNTQTLGGLVSHAWIEGPTTVALGDVDTQGFGGAVIPVRMLVP